MFFLILFLFFVNAADNCPVKNKMSPALQPQTVRGYLQNNKSLLSKPEDLICCLARDFEVGVVAAHNSIAGQNSDYLNPRVFLYVKKDNNLQAVMTVNGGSSSLQQAESVEFMYNNNYTQQVEFYDIDFSKKYPDMSSKNPESCMQCHGGSEMAPGYGPKTIFDPLFSWPRFVHNTRMGTDDQNSSCKQTDTIQDALDQKSLTAIKNNSRYKCITEDMVEGPNTFHHAVEMLNSRRIANWIRKQVAYDKYKYAIVGINLCKIEDLTKWLPPVALQVMTQEDTIPLSIKQSKDANQTKNLIADAWEKNRDNSLRVDQTYKDQIALIEKNKSINFEVELGPGQCSPRGANSEMIANTNITSTSNTTLNRYMQDSLLQSSSTNFGLYRFIFESRGINISDWPMQPTPGYTNEPDETLWKYLVMKESKNSPLSKTLAHCFNPKDIFNTTCDTARVCEKLQILSQYAFGPISPDDFPLSEAEKQ